MANTSKQKVITKETIYQVYEYKQKFGDKVTNVEVAKLCGIAESTVYRILKGEYDHLLKDEKKSNDSGNVSVEKQLGNISEQLYKLSIDIEDDSSTQFTQLTAINKELQSIGDLLHIIAVYLMRRENNQQTKTKMATQIQAVHSNQRISDALK